MNITKCRWELFQWPQRGAQQTLGKGGGEEDRAEGWREGAALGPGILEDHEL